MPFMYSGMPINSPTFQFSKAAISFICAMYWLRKETTPSRINNGDSQETSKERICTTKVEPTSAPNIKAKPGAVAIKPLAAKDTTRSAVAAELWRIPATPQPTTTAERAPGNSAAARQAAGTDAPIQLGDDDVDGATLEDLPEPPRVERPEVTSERQRLAGEPRHEVHLHAAVACFVGRPDAFEHVSLGDLLLDGLPKPLRPRFGSDGQAGLSHGRSQLRESA